MTDRTEAPALRATPVDAGDTRARRFRWLLRHHPLVFATAAVGVLGLVCVAAGAAPVADWVIGSYCAAIALFEGAKAVRQLLRRVWGLDVLAVTAIASTLLVGEFWASLVIVLMLTGGAALEDYAVERARGALTALLRQTPRVTHRNSGPVVDDVDVETVVVGDRLQVLPGETVPVDGILTSGTAVLDESALTGESMPVTRQQGQKVLSGAVNGGTVVEIRALAVAADSEFQRIVALVEAASNSKAPFVRLADRFAIPFTLVAYVVAGVAWAVSGDALRFAEVLVVATPCPLLIAAPVAFVAGMDRAAKSGIIVRSGGAFEQLARVRSAAFDKTGTLTYGRPNVDRIEPLSPYSSDELLVFVAAVESKSQHVLAGAVVQAARSARLQFRTAAGVVETPGKGAAAVVGGRRVVVGRIDFVDAGRSEWPGAPLGPGEMAVYASVDGVLAGRVVLRDETRGNSGASVRALRDFGVEQVVMLTGDGVDTAEHVGAEVGVEDIRASLLPAQKVAAMATLSPRPAMMVGDGVNDAPVLAAADVGVAMGARGSTAASETADVVVLVDDLDKVVEVVRIARRTIAVALQSIWVGIGLSLVLMVVAAFGVIPAIVGAGLQELVDVATIANALRAAARGRR